VEVRSYNGIGLELVAEHGAGRLLGAVDRQRDERRADDAERELELPACHGARLALPGEVGGMRPHPRLDVGASNLGGAGAAAGEHLLGDGHLQHRVQRVIALQVGAELPHGADRRTARGGLALLPRSAVVKVSRGLALPKVLRTVMRLPPSDLVPAFDESCRQLAGGAILYFATGLVVPARCC
jgi:hypothetical protein